jgi:hypothetical protein
MFQITFVCLNEICMLCSVHVIYMKCPFQSNVTKFRFEFHIKGVGKGRIDPIWAKIKFLF